MSDTTRDIIEEMVEQCCSLSLAIIEVSQPSIKESLTFILAEKLKGLSQMIFEVDILGNKLCELHTDE